jgi:integrase
MSAEQNPHDWHKRPKTCSRDENCPLCGCPADGTRKQGNYHRATAESEGYPFPFIVRKKSITGWVQAALAPPSSHTPKNFAVPIGECSGPGNVTLALIARAAVLYTTGKTFPQIERAMKLKRRAVATWSKQWPQHWQAVCQSAQTQIVKTVQAQMGTAAVLDDVDSYIERADAADRLLAVKGKSLIEPSDKPTLCTFFESYVLPTCLYDVRPLTVAYYRNSLRLWRLITGDPPLEAVTTETMTLFRDAVSKRRGKSRHVRMSADSVASRLRAIQTILDKAGPPARRNRDARGLIPCAPWIRPPRVTLKLPRVIPLEVFQAVYDATACMDAPRVPGIKPPAWWKALLVVAYNTQLRRRTLFEMRMDEIDWNGHCIRLPAERFKSGRPMIVHLNPAAVEALRGIRTDREFVFPWVDTRPREFAVEDPGPFYTQLHRLEDFAGLPRKEHFGLHAIRKTAATALAESSPRTAQLALGHTSLQTTINHYINPTAIIGAALDALPQPFGTFST